MIITIYYLEKLHLKHQKFLKDNSNFISCSNRKEIVKKAIEMKFDIIIFDDGLQEKWINYVSSQNVKTYVFKFKEDLVGFFELIFHPEKNEIEIAYFGILEEYQNKKLGSYLLSEAIKKSFKNSVKRVWVHTCSLDHKNALNNYISRGMKIFKTEILNI